MNQNQKPQQPPQINPIAIGIDLGSLQSVIAVAQKGGIQVLTNEANFRETPNVVGFGQAERYLGETGLTKLKTNFKDTVTYITRFLGLEPNSTILAEEKKFITAKTMTTEGGRLAFEVNYRGESRMLLPEQVMAAFISKLLHIIEINKIAKDHPVVLSVPAYANFSQRKALLDSASIAGMKVCRLLNESTAVALDYASNRKTQFLSKEPRFVLFVDLGHSKLSLTTVAFTKEKITVVQQHHERNLGCRDMDFLLLQFYRQLFAKSSGGLDIMENKKAIVKILETIQKQRKILSANSEHSLNMEYLMQDQDLSYNLRREQFQKLIQPTLVKLNTVLEKHKNAIDTLGIKLYNIELMGGGTRIPAVIRLIQSIFKVDPARTINSSEAVAKGCALMSAFKNPLFRPADFSIQELNCFQIQALWDFNREETTNGLPKSLKTVNLSTFPQGNQSILFPIGCQLPSIKQVKLKRKQWTDLALRYKTQTGFETLAYIQSRDHNLADPNKSLVFNLAIDENGLFSLSDCYVESDSQPNIAIQKLNPLQFFSLNLTPIMLTDLAMKERQMQIQDHSAEQTYQFKNKLEAYIYATKQKLGSVYKQYLSPEQYITITAHFEKINQWMYEVDVVTAHKELNNKSQEISSLLEPVNKRVKEFEEYLRALMEAKMETDELTKALQVQNKNTLHVPVKQRQRGLTQVDNLRRYFIGVDNECRIKPKYGALDPSLDDINRMLLSLREKVDSIMSKSTYGEPKKNSIFDHFTKSKW